MKDQKEYDSRNLAFSASPYCDDTYWNVKDKEIEEKMIKLIDENCDSIVDPLALDHRCVNKETRRAEGLSSSGTKYIRHFEVKRYLLIQTGVLKAYWMAKPFFKKRCLTVLSGPSGFGKTSLAVSFALNNIGAKPLWSGGPIGNNRGVFFFGGGCIDPEHVAQKIKGKPEGIKIFSKVYTDIDIGLSGNEKDLDKKDKDDRFCIDDILKVAVVENPAFVFFDYSLLNLDGWNPYLFNYKVFGLDTVFVGLLENHLLLKKYKAIPHLHLVQKGGDLFLTKPGGFADLPQGILRFNLEQEKDRFVVQGLQYLDKMMSDRYGESQADRFKKILAKFKADGGVMRTAEIKAIARKAGISTYFLQNLQWLDYGYKTKGEGFGSDFKQVLLPLEKH